MRLKTQLRLDNVFLREIPADIRIPVLTALTTQKLITGVWVDEERGGCAFYVAACGAIGSRLPVVRHMDVVTSGALMIPVATVHAHFPIWDSMTWRERTAFVERMRVALERMQNGEPFDPPNVRIWRNRPVPARVKQFMSALSVFF